MRMRRRNNLAPRMAACEPVWIHEPEALRGNWRSLMTGCRELRVEVGCGKGKFTVETAAQEPDVLLIAIEKVPDALVLAMESAMRMGLHNVFFVSLDADRIDEFFADDEIDLLYINFCDPWPKARHAKRWLTHVGFLRRYEKLLKKPGRLIFKTDNRPLFDFSLEQFAEAGLAVEDVSFDLHSENRPDNIMTEYERKFSGFGEKINRCEVVFA